MRGWWRRRTLRLRLALWYSLGGTVLLAAFSSAIYAYVARRMGQPLSLPLRSDIDAVRAHLSFDGQGRPFWDRMPLLTASPGRWDGPWFELWDEQDHLICRRWPLSDSQVTEPPRAPAEGNELLSIFWVAPELRLRALSVPYATSGPLAGWTLRVMRIHERMADPLGALVIILVVALPVVVSLLVLGGYAITRHWLSPLDKMVAHAERISAEDLDQRLPVVNPHDELGRLAGVFNHTLGRLDDSFRALDQFVADASHELRTPLTTLRSVGEVGLRRGRTADEYREIIGSMLEEAQRLQELIERLLELASTEGGTAHLHRETVRLDQLAAVCSQEMAILAEQKSQRLRVEAVACQVSSDPVLLRQALLNLVDNAMKYSPAGSTIVIGVSSGATTCELSVTDEGEGIPPPQMARLADRFYRVDSSRVRGQGGFGLGLAITKAYMRVLGGRLDCAAASPRGTRFSLHIPIA